MSAVLDAASGSLVGGAYSALQALSVVALVVAIAWVGRRLLLRGTLAPRSQHMHVEDRVALDLRHALVIVRVEQRRFLLATAEQSPARLIAELSPGAPDAAQRELP
ncbi:MAG: flagellar biosynthetic protein FliO [Polyangiales bacterium]